jgi:hypothetical protein
MSWKTKTFKIRLPFSTARPTFRPSRHGEVAEWSIAPHSKCGEPKGSGGSNPSLSAIFRSKSFGWHGHFRTALKSCKQLQGPREGCPGKPWRSRAEIRMKSKFALRLLPEGCPKGGPSHSPWITFISSKVSRLQIVTMSVSPKTCVSDLPTTMQERMSAPLPIGRGDW